MTKVQHYDHGWTINYGNNGFVLTDDEVNALPAVPQAGDSVTIRLSPREYVLGVRINDVVARDYATENDMETKGGYK